MIECQCTECQQRRADAQDALRYRVLKTIAHHSYNQKVVINAHSASLMKEELITVHAQSWEALDSFLDGAAKAMKEEKVNMTPQDKETQDQIAAVMLQVGTPEQQAQALEYAKRTVKRD